MIKTFSRYLLRICTFQIGEYNHGPFSRFLIKLMKKHYDLSDKRIPLNNGTLERYIHIIEDIGGKRYSKVSIDGLAQIDYVLLTYDNVNKRILQKGGKWIEIPVEHKTDSKYKIADASTISPLYLTCIYSESKTPEWRDFIDKSLARFGWERATVEFADGKKEVLVTHLSEEKSPVRKPACFLRCHSPGRSYGMEQKYIGKHLSIQKDICLFNYRGTHISTGTASEGGYYLDAETMYQELIQTYSYKPEQIWVTGFCLGGAVAAHLKLKYHHLGINYVGENTFTSLLSVILHQPWPASYMGKIALDAIQSTDKEIASRVEQDAFNTLEKFQKLKPENPSISIIINTDADVILPKDSGQNLFLAAKKGGPAFQLTHVSSSKGNPHADEVFEEKRIWNEYTKIVS
jgi:hypothetical protein